MESKPKSVCIHNFCGWDVLFKKVGYTHYDDIRIRDNDVRIYYKNVTLNITIDESIPGLRSGDYVKRAIVYPIQGFVRIWNTKCDTCFSISLLTLTGTLVTSKFDYPSA